MNEHAGPACALSGLIVGIFAVLLHDKTPSPPVRLSPAREVPAASSSGGGLSKSDAPAAIQQAQPRVIVGSPKPAEKPKPPVAPRPIQVAVSEPPRPPEPKVRPKPAVVKAPAEPPKPKSPPTPRPSFAIVEPGETLADVAVRIYGTKDAAEALWKANRDQVERVDSPLTRGTLLRAP